MKDGHVIRISKRQAHYILFAALMASGCDSGRMETDEQLIERSNSLQLQDRYDLYLKIYKSSTPRNPLLASEIVKLGLPARTYAINKARSATGADFQAALTIVSQFDQNCTAGERELLIERAVAISSSKSQQKALTDYVGVACGRKAPSGWQ
jgi:hypothetical protein